MIRIDEQLFPGTNSYSVVLFIEAPSITGLEHLPHQVSCITTHMLYIMLLKWQSIIKCEIKCIIIATKYRTQIISFIADVLTIII